MNQSRRRWVLLLMIGAGTLHQGCFSGGDDTIRCEGHPVDGVDDDDGSDSCPVPQKPRALHGTDGEGRVRITAEEAWPDRSEEPPRLTAEELATGCAAFVACGLTTSLVGLDTTLTLCTEGKELFSSAREERAIPWGAYNERFPFLIREVIEKKGDCAGIRSILTPAPSWLYCEEDGCIANASVGVTCEGAVAVFDDGSRRDCSRAHAVCSVESETGCTDRPFTRCEDGAKARCDGDVKLGCDGCGFVSYRDCAWNGGHCEETEEGAECVEPDATNCGELQNGCVDGAFERCVSGQKVRVDCGALGMECASTRYPGPPSDAPMLGICALTGLAAPCDIGFCQVRSGDPDAGAAP